MTSSLEPPLSRLAGDEGCRITFELDDNESDSQEIRELFSDDNDRSA